MRCDEVARLEDTHMHTHTHTHTHTQRHTHTNTHTHTHTDTHTHLLERDRLLMRGDEVAGLEDDRVGRAGRDRHLVAEQRPAVLLYPCRKLQDRDNRRQLTPRLCCTQAKAHINTLVSTQSKGRSPLPSHSLFSLSLLSLLTLCVLHVAEEVKDAVQIGQARRHNCLNHCDQPRGLVGVVVRFRLTPHVQCLFLLGHHQRRKEEEKKEKKETQKGW
jgi:hypothetical protein